MRHRTSWSAALALATALAAACRGGQGTASNEFTGPTPATHLSFPIASGPHAVDCFACHGTFPSFTQFDCLGCHAQAPTATVHPGVGTYLYDSTACYGCHQDPAAHPFDHRVAGTCASCHAAGTAYAALPVPQITHPSIGSLDCASCHATTGWSTVAAPTALVADPSRAVAVTAQVPAFAGTSLSALSPESETLPMPMDHASTLVAATGLACADCHPTAAAGSFFPGRYHDTLANHGLPPPATCGDCHATSSPTGIVGPLATSPARTPPSGEMRHEAVAWSGGVPTTTALVTFDCGACHSSPSATLQATWATDWSGASPARFHANLATASLAQPGSCLDCHANGRPANALAAPGAALPAGVQFDHAAAEAQGDCAACHSAVTVWTGGRHHHPGDANPTSCLPCHEGERPTSTAGWTDAGYASAPFDYGTNALGVTHGDGQDCATCHSGPGTGGSWGGTERWAGGRFPHGAGTVAATTCAVCHQAQRPDRLLGQAAAATALAGFDHAVNGTGDCIGCHQATVAAARYAQMYGSGGTLPGGDWADGAAYPGASLVGSPAQVVTVATVTLVRSGPGARVTGTTSGQATMQSQMLHVSGAIPAALNPGPASAPDVTTCWHCHAHDAQGTVTAYSGGVFHASLDGFSATVGGPVTPLPQPSSGCADCHSGTRPPAIVLGAGSDVVPMDHSAAFAAPTLVAGQLVAGVAALDCSACHQASPAAWSGGAFHRAIGAAAPGDCVTCHAPLMLDAAKADVASAPGYLMAHRSAQLPSQACATCHGSALTQAQSLAAGAAPAPSAWHPGALHASVPAQPTACLECHGVSTPGAATQSTVTYVLAAGGTSSNGSQWMNHRAAGLAGVDCVRCHAADARPSVVGWSRSASYHANVASPGACQTCHGLQNGNGAVAGTGNNLPAGLTSSSTATSAASDPTTGVPSGTLDQITHADVNVSAHDCAFCHTQVGPSSAPGVQGAEWAQARFHASFAASSPLVLNGTTGRCSSCHLGVRPGPSFTALDHSALTSAPGTQDCSTCHAWPGTGTAAAANWLGATNVPQFIAVGGFAVPQPPATAPTTQAGIASLPHPTLAAGMTCAACHAGGIGGRGATGYDHASALAAANCGACHEAGSYLLGSPWNGATTQGAGAGDTRAYTLTTIVATRGSGGDRCTITLPNHFYPVDCSECHARPPGTGAVTSGTPYTSAWTFPHATSKMSNPSTCNLCHVGQGCEK